MYSRGWRIEWWIPNVEENVRALKGRFKDRAWVQRFVSKRVERPDADDLRSRGAASEADMIRDLIF